MPLDWDWDKIDQDISKVLYVLKDLSRGDESDQMPEKTGKLVDRLKDHLNEEW